MKWDLSCLTEAKNLTLAVTALAMLLAEGKSSEEVGLYANIFSGLAGQLDILASFNCQIPDSNGDTVKPEFLTENT